MSEALAISDDAALFGDPDFTRAVQEQTKRRAKAFFHGRGFDRLIEMADSEDDRTALQAITAIGKLAGEFKAPRAVQLNFEDLRKLAATVDAGPLAGITQIREAEAIEGDVDDSDGTDE